MAVRNPPLAPGIKALMAQIELAPHERRTDLINKLAMGMGVFEHGPMYQQLVDAASGFSFIAGESDFLHCFNVGFGQRLRAAIKAAGYKSERKFALDLGWDPGSGPQRLSNYILKGRIPDRDTLKQMAAKLKTTPEALLNEADDAALRDILLHLLELEGIPLDKADTIATAFLVARRLHSAAATEGDSQMRARLAAHFAWQSQPHQEPDIQ